MIYAKIQLVVHLGGLFGLMVFDSEYKENLKNFGFNDLQILIFLVLTKQGKMDATSLGRYTKIPKTSVYRQLETLIARNFVREIKTSTGRKFEVNLGQFSEKAEAGLKKAEILTQKAKNLTSELEALRQSSTVFTEVKVYQGVDGLKQLQWNVLDAQDLIYYYTSADRRKLFGDRWIKKYWDEFVSRDLWERGFESAVNLSLDPKDYFSLSPGYLRRSEYKFVDNLNSQGEVYIYNNVYAMYTWENEELFGVEVYNSALVQTQRAIFEKLWNLTKSASELVYKHHPRFGKRK